MANDPLDRVRTEIALRVAEVRDTCPRLSSARLYAHMDAIRQLASQHGLGALEGLARCSAQLALLPGRRVTLQSCLERFDEALDSRCERDCTSILAAVAVRLH